MDVIANLESPAVRRDRERNQGPVIMQTFPADIVPFDPDVFTALGHSLADHVVDQVDLATTGLVTKVEDSLVRAFESLKLGLEMHARIPPPALHVSREVLAALRQLTNDPKAAFKSREQGQLAQATYRRDRHVAGILPTGGGKTLTFLISIILEQAQGLITFIFVPTNSLMRDLRDRIQEFGIECGIWISGQPPPTARCIIANYTASANPLTDKWLKQKAQENLLGRIVVDEFHYPLNNIGFRQELHKLKLLMIHKVPLLLLSATVPLQETDRLLAMYGLDQSQITIIRSATPRLNLGYRLSEYQGIHAKTHAAYGLKWKMKLMHGKHLGRLGMVFCQSINDVKDYAIYFEKADKAMDAALQLQHGDGAFVRNEGEKSGLVVFICWGQMAPEAIEKVLADWVAAAGQGKTVWLICSNYCGLGIDKPRVDFVFHFGTPSSFMDFAQESGRGGRTGTKALSLITYWYVPTAPLDDHNGRTEMISALTNNVCIRYQMQKYLDGEGFNCLSEPAGTA